MSRTLPSFVLRRLLGALAFVVVVSSTAFVLIRLAPGDETTEMKMTVADPSAIEAAKARLGLDRPVISQLGSWLGGLARFDLGTSSRFGRPVSGLVAERVGNTAVLAGLALALATCIGIPLGVISGAPPPGRRHQSSRPANPGRLGARVIGFGSILLVACPPILFSLALLYFSVSTWGWPSLAQGSLTLPLLALTLPMAAVIERLQSRATSETIELPALMAAAARGVPRGRLVWVHALRPSLQPVLGVYGLIVAALFSGSIAVETITGWSGLGRLMLDGLMGRDVFLVAGCALAGAALVALGNLAADVLRAFVDPRVREAM